jgi:penicillin-binding protein 1A
VLPRRRFAWAVLGTLALLAAGFGAATGYFVRTDMPDLRSLEDYDPAQMTHILARDGSEVASFAAEKRILLDYRDIPDSFRQALIASEDSRFNEHAGVDPIGGVRALWSDLRQVRMAQGASTLTMQLAGNLFLDRSQRTVRRKLQEAFLAMEIERQFSKQEIIRMYCNQVHFGHGLYGLEAAARYYFDKPARALTVGESATLVGLLPRPARYSPYRDMERATVRRDLVLRRMVAEGYLDDALARKTSTEPIVVASHGQSGDWAAYFKEGVRRRLHEDYGGDDLQRSGMSVSTTLDPRLQKIANEAVDKGLRKLDKRQGWRPDAVRRIPEGSDPQTWTSPAWAAGVVAGDVTDGVVLRSDAQGAEVAVAGRHGLLDAESVRWTGVTRPDRLVQPGDVIRVRLLGGDGDDDLRFALEQEPRVEAALVAIEPSTGEILALVGGFDFARSEYDRASQARRQPGSLFKPFVYAAALARGWTLADTLIDEPTVFLDPRNPVPYQPENFSRRYHGRITLRAALEESVNIATVKLLHRIGYDDVVETARALGVSSRLRPYPSLALGAFELTLLEATSAYGAFANQGLHLEPHWIRSVTDHDGRTIYRAKPDVTEAVSPRVAYLLNDALAGVIRRGTGRTAGEVLPQTLAGKTGTTDDYTDAWFVGYSTHLAVGVWVGHDEPRSLGDYETGARAALPIWIEFMDRALAGVPDEPFPIPDGIVRIPIDRRTGKRPHSRAHCTDVGVEVFVEGTEPAEPCTLALHRRLMLPHSFQRYGIDSGGALAIPGNELQELLADEREVVFQPARGELEAIGPNGYVSVPVTVLPDGEPPEEPPPAANLDPAGWVGTDGRRARVVWFEAR